MAITAAEVEICAALLGLPEGARDEERTFALHWVRKVGWAPMEDAREEIADQVEQQVGSRPPAALLDVWTGASPVDSASEANFYQPSDIAERNATYEVPAYRPDLLLIGDDGGGRGLFVPRDDPDPDLYLIGHGALGADQGERVGKLAELAADAFRAITSVDSADGGWPPDGPVDILISHPPEAGAKALMEIRRRLRLPVPISQLVGADAAFPMVVLTDVYYAKYARLVTDVNERYGCLTIRPQRAGDPGSTTARHS